MKFLEKLEKLEKLEESKLDNFNCPYPSFEFTMDHRQSNHEVHHRHASFIVVKGKVVAEGRNDNLRTTVFGKTVNTIHAEMDSLRCFLSSQQCFKGGQYEENK